MDVETALRKGASRFSWPAYHRTAGLFRQVVDQLSYCGVENEAPPDFGAVSQGFDMRLPSRVARRPHPSGIQRQLRLSITTNPGPEPPPRNSSASAIAVSLPGACRQSERPQVSIPIRSSQPGVAVGASLVWWPCPHYPTRSRADRPVTAESRHKRNPAFPRNLVPHRWCSPRLHTAAFPHHRAQRPMASGQCLVG